MSGARIALCVDEETWRNPALVGLEGESLEAQDWLAVYADGEEARAGIAADRAIVEAWVVSCEDVEPINLAATLKADRPELCVRLVGFEGNGSLYSRAYNASIDEVMEASSFVKRYADEKRRARPMRGVTADVPVAVRAVPPAEELSAEEAVAALPLPATLPPAATALARPRGFVLPIVSGSGGAGKSSVAVASAFIASKMGYRVLLLDYDLQFGDACALAGAAAGLAIDEALAHPEQLEQLLMKNLNPTVIAAPRRLEDAERTAHDAASFIDDLAGAFDLVVANTGAAWAEYHAALLERSSAALFLVDQRASSIRACRHALELCARCGIATGPFQFALNRCRKGSPLSPVDVSCALQGAFVHEIEDGGPDVEDFLGAGAVSDLIESGNPFCTSLERVLTKVLPGAGLLGVERMEAAPEKRSARRRARHAGRRRGWPL